MKLNILSGIYWKITYFTKYIDLKLGSYVFMKAPKPQNIHCEDIVLF